MKRALFIIFSVVLLLPLTLTETANAQWSLGASYEVRDEDPANGFGIRLQRDILSAAPLVDIGVRAHFSYFNQSNSLTREGATSERDFETFDVGVAATGGISVGLVRPYVGLGMGWDNSSLEISENVSGTGIESREPYDKTDLYWNAFLGAEITIIPMVSPFIEYRFSQVSDRGDINLHNVSRLALGVSLRF